MFRVFLFFQLVHFVNRDSLGLANDYHSLGFLPEGVDIQAVADALQKSFRDGTRQSRDFQVLYVFSLYIFVLVEFIALHSSLINFKELLRNSNKKWHFLILKCMICIIEGTPSILKRLWDLFGVDIEDNDRLYVFF